MKTMRRLIILVVLLGILIGCQQIKQGTVIEKVHRPAYMWVQMIPVSDGKTITFVPITHYVPDTWYIVIEGKNDKGELEKASYTISFEDYEHIQIGEWVNMGNEDN